jgi:hypothetical protein
VTQRVRVTEARPASPHTEALVDAGKDILVQSVAVGREFCKFMIGTSTAAIPTYLALVGLATGKAFRPSVGEGVALVAPAVLFLVAAGVFAVGYFPGRVALSLESPDSIETARAQIIDRRNRLSALGFGLFAVSVLAAIAGAVYALTLDIPPAP